ncbi:MAG: hypothetical protein FJ293_08630 [Planctomycetes bacterium]|nr:hypothetical protein [Planctomycetota bacterium]
MASRRWWVRLAVFGLAAVLVGGDGSTAAPGPGEEIEAGFTTRRARSLLEFALPPPRKITELRWTGDWNAALLEAERRNVPIVAVLSDDASAGFQTVTKFVYSKPEFAAFSHDVVLVAAYGGGKHGATKRMVDGEEVEWCPLFDVPCDDHRASEVLVRNTFAQREFWNPLHVFVSCSGIELTRAEGHELRFDRLEEELKLATRERQGAWLSYRAWRELLERVAALLATRQKRGVAAVHLELGKWVAAEKKAVADPKLPRTLHTPAMVAWVEQLREALLEEAEGRIEDAVDAARAGQVTAARRLLGAIAREAKGLPPEKSAQAALAKLPAGDPEKRKGG